MTPLKTLVSEALAEDRAFTDITTEALQLGNKFSHAQIIAKEDLVLSGVELATESFKQLNNQIEIKWQYQPGQMILKNQIVALISGPAAPILSAERVALNFLGRLSGIATLTRCFVKALEGTRTTLLDTRKTTPLYREFDKKAVRDGGGTNHRMNLEAAILIKENHIKAAGGIKQAVTKAGENSNSPIEIEVQNLQEVKEAVELKVHRILLDNMSNEIMALALKIIPSHIETEASGNMNLDRIRSVAELGVQYISVGALTHSAPCADFSLRVE